MPQASQETLDKFVQMGGQGPQDDEYALAFLSVGGWTLTKNFQWIPPAGIVHVKEITDEEWACIHFLFEEWDYGGIDESICRISPSGDLIWADVLPARVVEDVAGVSEQGTGVCEVCDTAPEEQCSGC